MEDRSINKELLFISEHAKSFSSYLTTDMCSTLNPYVVEPKQNRKSFLSLLDQNNNRIIFFRNHILSRCR